MINTLIFCDRCGEMGAAKEHITVSLRMYPGASKEPDLSFENATEHMARHYCHRCCVDHLCLEIANWGSKKVPQVKEDETLEAVLVNLIRTMVAEAVGDR